jgi:hypothetical protein
MGRCPTADWTTGLKTHTYIGLCTEDRIFVLLLQFIHFISSNAARPKPVDRTNGVHTGREGSIWLNELLTAVKVLETGLWIFNLTFCVTEIV